MNPASAMVRPTASPPGYTSAPKTHEPSRLWSPSMSAPDGIGAAHRDGHDHDRSACEAEPFDYVVVVGIEIVVALDSGTALVERATEPQEVGHPGGWRWWQMWSKMASNTSPVATSPYSSTTT